MSDIQEVKIKNTVDVKVKNKINLDEDTLRVIASIVSKAMNEVCHRLDILGVELARIKEQGDHNGTTDNPGPTKQTPK